MKNKILSNEENKALIRLKELAKIVAYHNKLYHEKNIPKISDNKFNKSF